ncbi:MAG: hypothetical protein QF859_07110 [Candidatus Marinimicrobia bacterium]|jgi:hypothetical protein|nr:hypothetical protein [Candidatus Neomarinimicrobiota bacterium]MDP7475714.1 hypothetical protein [Candidatus Neomarinimicrobiota bacterium]MEE1507023.1 hypothetical protein [Candidatus Neomarinimicrobiota bacterium]|tara:strand:- start:2005 stop:2667 length:663 start_codon:yes stop_codon:yes gene_type:complete
MQKTIMSILTAIFVVMIIGCGEKPQPKPEPPKKQVEVQKPNRIYEYEKQKSVPLTPSVKPTGSTGIPDWYLNPNFKIPTGFIGGVGNETSRDMGTALEKAKNAARGELRMNAEDIGEAGSDRFKKETGFNDHSKFVQSWEVATRSASDAMLKNTKTVISDVQKDGSVYRAYVLMTSPNPELAIVDELQKDEELWVEFQKTEFFNDLHSRLEEYKKSQTNQ